MSAVPSRKDHRVEATEKIWKYGVAMLAVSLPFVFIAKLIMLPIYVIVLAAMATLGVWMFGGRQYSSKEESRLEARLEALEERLANVETITRVEMQLGRRHHVEAGEVPPPLAEEDSAT